MSTKLFISSILCLLLSGCLTNNPSKVVVIDKSFNKANATDSYIVETSTADSSSYTTKVVTESNTSKSGSWSIPVDAEILKKYSPEDQQFGITFATHTGQEVRSIRDGTVVYSDSKMKSYGEMIIIKHAFGFYSSYTQNQVLHVREGDQVVKGQLIALTGNQPFYFEMKKYSDTINPLKYIK